MKIYVTMLFSFFVNISFAQFTVDSLTRIVVQRPPHNIVEEKIKNYGFDQIADCSEINDRSKVYTIDYMNTKTGLTLQLQSFDLKQGHYVFTICFKDSNSYFFKEVLETLKDKSENKNSALQLFNYKKENDGEIYYFKNRYVDKMRNNRVSYLYITVLNEPVKSECVNCENIITISETESKW